MRLKKMVLGAILVGAVIAPSLASAATSPWNRSCPKDDLVISPYLPYNAVAPDHVGMSYQTARSIVQRSGPEEFAPPSQRLPATFAPCWVMQTVTDDMVGNYNGHPGGAFDEWGSRLSGWINVTLDAYDGSVHLGRFYCNAAFTGKGGQWPTTCHHNADRNAGGITVRFVTVQVTG